MRINRCLLLLFGLGSPLFAQPGNYTDDEDIITLNPFLVDVSGDVGYRASNTVSGTSLNIQIRDLPMPMEIITSEFLEDTGVTSFAEALAYSSGVFTEQYTEAPSGGRDAVNSPGANTSYSRDRSASSRGGVGGRYANSIIIRGFNVPFQNRDGFRMGGQIAHHGLVLGGAFDPVNVERIEVVRGPNSLLYGLGVLSGIANVIPKRPLSEQRQQVTFGVGSWDYRRATLDITGPVKRDLFGGQLNYRFATAHQSQDHWTDFQEYDREYYVGQLEFRNRWMTVLLEGQYSDQSTRGIGAGSAFDNLAAAVDQDFRNEYGEHLNWQKDFGGFDERYRLTGPDTYHDRLEKNLLLNVDIHPVKNLVFSLGGFYTKASEDIFDVNISTITNAERTLNLEIMHNRLLESKTSADLLQQTQEFFDNMVYAHPLPPELVDPARRDNTDYKVLRYFWVRSPRESETRQYRMRGTYTFETPFFGDSPAKHTFLAGRQDIQDIVDFTTGTTSVDWQFDSGAEYNNNDPLMFRHVFDHTPIRYNGEAVALPGSEYRRIKVWYTGHYALYQGSYFNDRLTIIGGIRHDRYGSADYEYDRGVAGIGVRPNPGNVSYPINPDPLTQTRGPNAEGKDSAVTRLLAASYRINDAFSVYGLVSEGMTPNTGARDGNWDGIPSEKSLSKEIGLKFDLLDKRISGTVSVYQIRRDNAIWNWERAPATVRWVGSGVKGQEGNTSSGFDPSIIGPAPLYPVSFMVDKRYFDGVDLGRITVITPDERRSELPKGLVDPGVSLFQNDIYEQTMVVLEYEHLDEPALDASGNPTGHSWRHYLEKAFADVEKGRLSFTNQSGPEDYDPIAYVRIVNGHQGLSASIQSAIGADVTYTDEATGGEIQLFISPTANWQIIFNYAYTSREAVSPFNLVSVAPFGTEYDSWVRVFGREAFGLNEHDDDGDGVVDRVTRNGQPIQLGDVDATDMVGGLQGTSLYFGSEHSASLWTKYTFTDGPLDGFELGFGANYTGPAQTSVEIGGQNFAGNRFRTPSTEERLQFDSMIRYRFNWGRAYWSVSLNVYNLLDDRHGETVVHYDHDGRTILRRTEAWYAPRNFRLSASISF